MSIQLVSSRANPFGVGALFKVCGRPAIVIDKPNDTTLTIKYITWRQYFWWSVVGWISRCVGRIFRK